MKKQMTPAMIDKANLKRAERKAGFYIGSWVSFWYLMIILVLYAFIDGNIDYHLKQLGYKYNDGKFQKAYPDDIFSSNWRGSTGLKIYLGSKYGTSFEPHESLAYKDFYAIKERIWAKEKDQNGNPKPVKEFSVEYKKFQKAYAKKSGDKKTFLKESAKGKAPGEWVAWAYNDAETKEKREELYHEFLNKFAQEEGFEPYASKYESIYFTHSWYAKSRGTERDRNAVRAINSPVGGGDNIHQHKIILSTMMLALAFALLIGLTKQGYWSLIILVGLPLVIFTGHEAIMYYDYFFNAELRVIGRRAIVEDLGPYGVFAMIAGGLTFWFGLGFASSSASKSKNAEEKINKELKIYDVSEDDLKV